MTDREIFLSRVLKNAGYGTDPYPEKLRVRPTQKIGWGKEPTGSLLGGIPEQKIVGDPEWVPYDQVGWNHPTWSLEGPGNLVLGVRGRSSSFELLDAS